MSDKNHAIKLMCSNPSCITAGGMHYRRENSFQEFVCRACGHKLVPFKRKSDIEFNKKAKQELKELEL